MGVVPVVCLDRGAGEAVSAALQRSGVSAPIVQITDVDGVLPSGDAYVLVDESGIPVTRALTRRGAERAALRRSIAYAPSVPATDIVDLEEFGVRYYCNSNNGLPHLFKLIGQIKADILLDSPQRLREAEAVALAVFQGTTSALDLFEGRTVYTGDFYGSLATAFHEKIVKTPLALLVDAISRNHEHTIQHSAFVTTLATAFAAHLGFSEAEIERVFLAAFFHDIGKSAIPKAVIDKPAKLTDDEMRLMRTHVTVGYEMLRRFPETEGEIADVAISHHEYLDGSGYPLGLRGKEIPDLVRIVTIADIYGALIERRAYKPPFPPEKAFAILREMDGKLDQELVTMFQPVAEQLLMPRRGSAASVSTRCSASSAVVDEAAARLSRRAGIG